MKRSREKEIMFGAFQRAGYEVTADIGRAVSDGLRQIRQERFNERMAQKAKMRRNAPPDSDQKQNTNQSRA